MSLSGNLSGISFSGLGSGIDTNSIISQLMQIEAIPVSRMQSRQAQLTATLGIYGQLQGKIVTLNAAAAGLSTSSSFDPSTASVGDSTIASVSASSAASAGSYSLTVHKLAKAHKVVSNSQVGADTALNLSGQVVVDGESFDVTATDTLTSIAKKINGLGTGAVASIIKDSNGTAYLSLTSKTTGVANKLQVADVSGSVMQSLGIINGTTSYREPVSGGFRSYGFSNATDTIKTMSGAANSGIVTVEGNDVNIDFQTDSLSSVAAKINLAAGGSGVTASVKEVTEGGRTVQKLEVTGLTGQPVDSNNLLAALGVFQNGYSNEVIEAKDASYKLDGIELTSYTNSVTDAAAGITFNLLKDETQGSATTTIDISRDTSKIKASFKSYMDAFNGLMDFVKTNSAFDADTFDSGPLFGDTVTSQAVSAVQSSLFDMVGSGKFRSMADIGFQLDSDGKLTLDESKLDAALSSDTDAVKAIMVSSGTSANEGIAFVSSINRTKDSGTSGYLVDITQAATIASNLSGSAMTQPSVGGEELTFSGKAFKTDYKLTIGSGKTLAEIVNLINADSTLKDKVVASVDTDGKLKIAAQKYGSASDFTVVSNLDAADDNTGFGTAGGVHTTGFDVAGTINGEEATGTGQYLLGKDTNANTAGLQIQYTGTTTGQVGTLRYTRGLSSRMLGSIETVNDVTNGLLPATQKSIQSQIDDLTDQIKSFQDTLVIRQDTLKKKFLAMEQAIASLQQQQAQMAASRSGSG
ncbi:MAG: flagellar filament capping protein FliD [Armatimonadetes bacterium]|nr:flagellar filament capping protein FliD [Armatimonadota bacterium]